MTIEEAELRGCPSHIVSKLKKYGVSSFSTPHNLDNINWGKIENDVDYMMSGIMGTDASPIIKDEPIRTRFEILDL